MSKRKKKKRPKAFTRKQALPLPSPTTTAAMQQPPDSKVDLLLWGAIPGALMIKRPYPEWVLPHDPPRRSQISSFGSSTAFAHVPDDERQAIFESAAKTYTRASHYEARYKALHAELDKRRDDLPGSVFWDGLIEYVHFELQAFAGACRTLLDELVYIIARRHNIVPARARKRPWETSDLVTKALEQECDVEEIRLLRTEPGWFDTLNAYRNSFFHHGWRHGWGHFSAEDLRDATASAASNGLLLPDRDSLVARRKPFEWTWTRKTTADDVATEIRRGTDWLIDELGRIWNVPLPSPGTAPLDGRPNMMVRLTRPGLLYSDDAVFLPVFSTRELGLACHELSCRPGIELVDVPLSTLPLRSQKAISVALHGLDPASFGGKATHLDVVLDPEPDKEWKAVKAAAHTRISLTELAARPTTEPLVIPMQGCERVWIWESQAPREW